MNRTLAGTLLVLLSTLGYATFPIFSKLAYRGGVATFDLLTWRFILAAGLMWLVFPLWRRQAALRTLTRRDLIVLGGLGAWFALSALTAFEALARIPATSYTIIINIYPALVALISFVLGERLPVLSWLAIGLAFIGCVLTAGAELDLSHPLGVLIAVANALTIAIYMSVAGRQTKHIPGMASGVLIITATMLTLLIGAGVHGLGTPPTQTGWAGTVGVALFGTVVGITALLAGMTYIGPSRAAILSAAGPPLTVALAAIFLGEQMHPIQYAGGTLTVISLLLLQIKPRPGGQPAAGVVVGVPGDD